MEQLCGIRLADWAALAQHSSNAGLLDQDWQSSQSSSWLNNFPFGGSHSAPFRATIRGFCPQLGRRNRRSSSKGAPRRRRVSGGRKLPTKWANRWRNVRWYRKEAPWLCAPQSVLAGPVLLPGKEQCYREKMCCRTEPSKNVLSALVSSYNHKYTTYTPGKTYFAGTYYPVRLKMLYRSFHRCTYFDRIYRKHINGVLL